ncbi:glycosyl hydrolase [Pantoea coffeiphila]|uniref:Asl1-like glycosyl hydrolase catalytic domain-containing protein n=1 Tax=Pantoea coffeiphila TaxID=1465635 RepID=A0A2S9IG71_9GAMM|nr:glycosyl hydrolase [Pantoea coffeiphila]PRD16790.1 hypothetical protein CQW29_03755 [Pantoea coffeiphila]
MLKKSKFFYLTCLALSLQSYVPLSNAEGIVAGVGIHPEKFKRDPEELLQLMKNYGVMSFRTDFPWQQVEKKKNKYTFPSANFEKLIDSSLKEDMPFILILGYGNKNYEDFTDTNPWGKPTKESTINAFSNYAQWSAENVNHDSVTFEIWNEWIQMAGKKNRKSALSDESAVMYAKLVNESCLKIKKVNPNIKVIAGGISPLDPASIRWMEKVIDLKGMDCTDGISLHPYDFSMFRKLSAQKTFNSISKFHNELLSKYNKSYPLYITETGVPDGVTTNKSQSEVSDYIKEYFKLAENANYIKGIWWYDFINDGNNIANREHNFGLLKNNLEPKLGAQTFKSVAESK